MYERQVYWLAEELEKIAGRFDPALSANIELHGAEMKNGRYWRQFPPADRVEAIKDALSVLANSHASNRIFAVAVKKGAVSPDDPVEFAFEQLTNRFDRYLQRLHLRGDTQRGLVILDRVRIERRLQTLASEFRTVGHRWGVLRNLAEVPVFMDSKATRLLQLADLVSYALLRHLQHDDDVFFDIIRRRFDQANGVIHGLSIHVRH